MKYDSLVSINMFKIQLIIPFKPFYVFNIKIALTFGLTQILQKTRNQKFILQF